MRSIHKLLLVAFLIGIASGQKKNVQDIPIFRGINCNTYQLFTCLASKKGQMHPDCCDAIRNVLSPRCLCSKERVGRTVVKTLLPIALTCQVLLDIGEPCDPSVPRIPLTTRSSRND